MTEEVQSEVSLEQSAPQEVSLRDALRENYEKANRELNDNEPEGDQEVADVDLEDVSEDQEEDVSQLNYDIPKEWNEEEQSALKHLMETSPEQAKILLDNRYTKIHNGFNEKSQELASYKQQYDQFGELFKKHEGQLALAGMTPYDAVSRIVALDEQLRTDPTVTIRNLARLHNVDLLSSDGEYTEEEYVDPQVQKMQATIDGFQKQLQQQTVAQDQYQQRQIQEVITTFYDQKDEAGN